MLRLPPSPVGARASGAAQIDAEAVRASRRSRRNRNARIEDRTQESIQRGTVMISTSGGAVGQVNGLTVRDTGDHAFGAPSRVTARTSIGRRGVTNIERETSLGGPIQQKGAMVIQGFLAGLFARRTPLSFNASITFEQSYGGVEGDTELRTSVEEDLPRHRGAGALGVELVDVYLAERQGARDVPNDPGPVGPHQIEVDPAKFRFGLVERTALDHHTQPLRLERT